MAVGWRGTKLKDVNFILFTVARVSFEIQQTQAHSLTFSDPAVPHLFSFCIFVTVKCS